MSGRVSSLQVVKTWALLVSVPVYFGGAVLWIREEVKESLAIKADAPPLVHTKAKLKNDWKMVEVKKTSVIHPPKVISQKHL